MVYETIAEAAADVGVTDWLCYMYPVVEAEDRPAWDAPLTDEQFADVLATAEAEDW